MVINFAICTFSFAHFLKIWFKFAIHLDGNQAHEIWRLWFGDKKKKSSQLWEQLSKYTTHILVFSSGWLILTLAIPSLFIKSRLVYFWYILKDHKWHVWYFYYWSDWMIMRLEIFGVFSTASENLMTLIWQEKCWIAKSRARKERVQYLDSNIKGEAPGG